LLESLVRIEVNGTQIYFDVEGTGLEIGDGQLKKKPTLIALHGGPGFDHGYLRPGLGPLRDHAQVIYVDQRGQGRSARPPIESCTLEQWADDIAAFCETLEIARPVVFGHSAGGFVAMHLAIRHPELVGGLILCGSSPRLAPIEDGGPPAPTLASRAGPDVLAVAGPVFSGAITPESLAAFTEKVMPFYAGPSHMDVSQRILPLSSANVDVMRHFFDKLAASYDVVEQLPLIEAPTLVMVGQHDWVAPPRASRAITRGIPNAKMVEIAGAGHYPFSEEPQRFLAEVVAFLRDLT
jgi:pimeloyl-ACP methyl ester carboxylesterase